MGVYHPHPEYHHIKKENIGLIEVMGLAVLPARLKKEMAELEHRILNKENLWESDLTKSHAEWAEKWMPNYEITDDNIHAIVQKEIGFVFAGMRRCLQKNTGRTSCLQKIFGVHIKKDHFTFVKWSAFSVFSFHK